MSIESRELTLFATNTYSLYVSRALPIIANLRKKIAKGTYDPTLALKAWQYLADDAAKLYVKEFGGSFTKADRIECAAELAECYNAELED